MASRRKGRILAFQALYCWEANRIPADELMTFSWLESEKQAALDSGIAGFSRLLIAGTIENIKVVDSMIKRHLQNWDISRLNRVDLAILRMSVYALIFQTDIAPSIIIDEAIGISKEFGTDVSYRFINGVLDSIRRTLQEPQPDSALRAASEQAAPKQAQEVCLSTK
ncbi:MAG: transcription antitermination factor NusB [Treponema sp.]|jgi:N utilization substance protein B|nr:transcription antitermination factor NusB [Treponema sp.]